VNETDLLQNLQTKQYRVYVAAGTSEFKATLAYSDYWGTTSSTVHRINAVTLKVTTPGGTIYYGNNGLIGTSNYSTAGGSENLTDNIQNVFLQNPSAGVYTIEVRAAAVNQDGHAESAEMDVDYSLVASGVRPWATLNSIATTKGIYVSGGLPEASTSNNAYYVFGPQPPILITDPSARVEVVATSPVTSVTGANVTLEFSTTTIGCTAKVKMYNWTTGFYDQVGTMNPIGADSVVSIDLPTPGNYVNASTGQMKLQFDVDDSSAVTPGWQGKLDQVRIQITP
jgi:hypothetical protein